MSLTATCMHGEFPVMTAKAIYIIPNHVPGEFPIIILYIHEEKCVTPSAPLSVKSHSYQIGAYGLSTFTSLLQCVFNEKLIRNHMIMKHVNTN